MKFKWRQSSLSFEHDLASWGGNCREPRVDHQAGWGHWCWDVVGLDGKHLWMCAAPVACNAVTYHFMWDQADICLKLICYLLKILFVLSLLGLYLIFVARFCLICANPKWREILVMTLVFVLFPRKHYDTCMRGEELSKLRQMFWLIECPLSRELLAPKSLRVWYLLLYSLHNCHVWSLYSHVKINPFHC